MSISLLTAGAVGAERRVHRAAGILEPGERHWDILRGLVQGGQTVGPLVMDAVLAAIALEHGATICTTDRDFTRFSGLKWTNPLATNG